MNNPTHATVNCTYGAPMGRHGEKLDTGLKVQIQRVKLDSGGYDPGGAYWGTGHPLYVAFDESGGAVYLRAEGIAAAKKMLLDEYDCELEFGHEMSLDDFTVAYIECALWSSTDDDGEPLDSEFDESDLSPECRAEMARDCKNFLEANEADLEGMNAEQAGHDFWLTRNGHGAGFWDRGLGELGRRLADACKPYGGVDLYVGDDGQIHS